MYQSRGAVLVGDYSIVPRLPRLLLTTDWHSSVAPLLCFADKLKQIRVCMFLACDNDVCNAVVDCGVAIIELGIAIVDGNRYNFLPDVGRTKVR